MLMLLPRPQRLNMFVAAVVDDDVAASDVDDDDVQQRLQQPPTLKADVATAIAVPRP